MRTLSKEQKKEIHSIVKEEKNPSITWVSALTKISEKQILRNLEFLELVLVKRKLYFKSKRKRKKTKKSKNDETLHEIKAKAEEVKQSLDILENESIIHPVILNPQKGPKPLSYPSNRERNSVMRKIIRKIPQVKTKEYKLILVYESQKVFIKNYIGELSKKIGNMGFVDMGMCLSKLIEKKELKNVNKTENIFPSFWDYLAETQGQQSIPGNVLRKVKSVFFPIEFKNKLTKEECKSCFKESIRKPNNEEEITEDYPVVGIFDLDNLMGNTHLFVEDEITFLEAILELSKEYILITNHPKSTYGRSCPGRLFNKVDLFVALRIEITPYNTSKIRTLPIINQLIEKAIVVKTGR